jgi:hypothetical protein
VIPQPIAHAARRLVEDGHTTPGRALTAAVRATRAMAVAGHPVAARAIEEFDAYRAEVLMAAAAGETVDLAAVNGHHVPGTAYNWKHGYIPLNVQTALLHKKKQWAAKLHKGGAAHAHPEPEWWNKKNPHSKQTIAADVKGKLGQLGIAAGPSQQVKTAKKSGKHVIQAPAGKFKEGQEIYARLPDGSVGKVKITSQGKAFGSQSGGQKQEQYQYTELKSVEKRSPENLAAQKAKAVTAAAGAPEQGPAKPPAPKPAPKLPAEGAKAATPAVASADTPKAAAAPKAPASPTSGIGYPDKIESFPDLLTATKAGKTIPAGKTTGLPQKQAATFQKAVKSGTTHYIAADPDSVPTKKKPNTATDGTFGEFRPDGSVYVHQAGSTTPNKLDDAKIVATLKPFQSAKFVAPINADEAAKQAKSNRTGLVKQVFGADTDNAGWGLGGQLAKGLNQAVTSGKTTYYKPGGKLTNKKPTSGTHFEFSPNGEVTQHNSTGTSKPIHAVDAANMTSFLNPKAKDAPAAASSAPKPAASGGPSLSMFEEQFAQWPATATAKNLSTQTATTGYVVPSDLPGGLAMHSKPTPGQPHIAITPDGGVTLHSADGAKVKTISDGGAPKASTSSPLPTPSEVHQANAKKLADAPAMAAPDAGAAAVKHTAYAYHQAIKTGKTHYALGNNVSTTPPTGITGTTYALHPNGTIEKKNVLGKFAEPGNSDSISETLTKHATTPTASKPASSASAPSGPVKVSGLDEPGAAASSASALPGKKGAQAPTFSGVDGAKSQAKTLGITMYVTDNGTVTSKKPTSGTFTAVSPSGATKKLNAADQPAPKPKAAAAAEPEKPKIVGADPVSTKLLEQADKAGALSASKQYLSENAAVALQKAHQTGKPQYVVPDAGGWKITSKKPDASVGQHYELRPDGTEYALDGGKSVQIPPETVKKHLGPQLTKSAGGTYGGGPSFHDDNTLVSAVAGYFAELGDDPFGADSGAMPGQSSGPLHTSFGNDLQKGVPLQSQYAKAVAPALTAGEKDAIKKYTGNGYYTALNNALRSGGSLSPTQKKIVDGINSAASKFKLDKPMNLSRGFYATPDFPVDGHLEAGTVYEDKGVGSLAYDAAGWGGNVKWSIYAPAGLHGIHVGGSGAGTYGGGEKEMIMPPGTRYMVMADETTAGVRHVTMVALPQDWLS